MKAKGKGYHARNTKPLIGGWLQLFMQMYRNVFLSETVHLLFKRIILEIFTLHYFFLTPNTCHEYLAP